MNRKDIIDEANAWAIYGFEDDRSMDIGISNAFMDEGLHSLDKEEMKLFLDQYCKAFRVNMKRYLRANYNWEG